MAEKSLTLEIITPTSRLYCEQVDSVIAPAVSGYFGVLPGHAPYMVALGIGEIKAKKNGKVMRFATTGGFAEVLPDKVTLLATTAELAEAIDHDRAKAAAERAQKRVQEGRESWDLDRAHVALTRAFNRMKVAKKL